LNLIWRLLFTLIRHQAKLRFLSEAKRKGTLAYLRALQGARWVLIGLIMVVVLFQVMVLAGFGALITGFMLWETDYTFKLQILFAAFLALSGLPALGLAILCSERMWYKASGAEKMVERLRQDEKRESA
jgi:hypothetical protein